MLLVVVLSGKFFKQIDVCQLGSDRINLVYIHDYTMKYYAHVRESDN